MRATEIGGEGLGDAAPTLVIARKDTLGKKVVDVDVADPAVEGGTGGVRLPTLLKRTAGILDGAAAEIVVVDGAQRGEVVANGELEEHPVRVLVLDAHFILISPVFAQLL